MIAKEKSKILRPTRRTTQRIRQSSLLCREMSEETSSHADDVCVPLMSGLTKPARTSVRISLSPEIGFSTSVVLTTSGGPYLVMDSGFRWRSSAAVTPSGGRYSTIGARMPLIRSQRPRTTSKVQSRRVPRRSPNSSISVAGISPPAWR